MELADFFAIDRLSQHDEELLIESAMQMQQMMMLYESGIREIKTKLDNLNDIGGIRVICPFIEDIYTVADMLMRQDDLTLIEKKDYIANPKPNGYRSLHLILEVPIFLAERTQPVRIELQIRTMAMDFWASLEHQLRYKSDVEIPEHMSDDLKKCADVIAETDQEMQRIAKELKVL